jgi:hypothetical protein
MALELRTGIARAAALGPAAAAAVLHMTPRAFARAQARALARLTKLSRTGACGEKSSTLSLQAAPSLEQVASIEASPPDGAQNEFSQAGVATKHGASTPRRTRSAHAAHAGAPALLAALRIPGGRGGLMALALALLPVLLIGLLFVRRADLWQRCRGPLERLLGGLERGRRG